MLLHRGVREGTTSFPRLFHFTIDSCLIMLRRHQILFCESLVWLDLRLNSCLPDHWRTLYWLDHWLGRKNFNPDSTNQKDGEISQITASSSLCVHISSISDSLFGGARGVMVIVAGNGHGDTSSNPGLIAFHIALIPLGKVWIQLFSLQLWVNSRAD